MSQVVTGGSQSLLSVPSAGWDLGKAGNMSHSCHHKVIVSPRAGSCPSGPLLSSGHGVLPAQIAFIFLAPQ